MTTTVIHPTDFSEEAKAAEAEAVRLARALGGELVLLHVAVEAPLYGETAFGRDEVRRVYEEQARWAENELAGRARRLGDSGVVTRWRRSVGIPHDEIVKAAQEERAAYIVMGTHGRAGFVRFMLGSVADRVVRTATCPVVTVRPASG
ncbi:MAG: universal stress protein [Candidatus Rokuibacteriota bacterium]